MEEKITVRCTDDYYFEQYVKRYKSLGYTESSPRKYGWGKYSVEMTLKRQA